MFHYIDKANAINKFFTDISCINDEPDLPPQGPGPPLHHMETFRITENEVLDQLQIINICKPSGPDGVSPQVLKYTAQSIYKPLTKLFNISLTMELFLVFGKLPKLLLFIKIKEMQMMSITIDQYQ